MPRISTRWSVAGVILILAAVTVLVFRRLLNAGFFHDDWTLLARATGYLPPLDWPVRPLAFDLYWRALGMLPGPEPMIYTVSRLLVHLGTAAVLARIVERLGAPAAAQMFAAALYTFTPLAFEALYWAAGITELLATLGLVIAVLGLITGNRHGLMLFACGCVITLASKETGWWLPIGALMVWRSRGSREYLIAAGGSALVVVYAVSSTIWGLGHDYTWTITSVPWNFLRAGSWLLPRPNDLIHVWVAPAETLVLGGAVWTAWAAWAVWRRRRRRDPTAGLALLACLLSLAPVVGLEDHFVPRYMLPVQACLSAAIVLTVPWRSIRRAWPATTAVAMGLALLTNWQVNQMLDQRFGGGRPMHRLVAKDLMVRIAWQQLIETAGSPIAFLTQPQDDVYAREYVLDMIGRTWGPQVILGPGTKVTITDDLHAIQTGTHVFQFAGWQLDYLGVLTHEP